jgi:hypothetical protein
MARSTIRQSYTITALLKKVQMIKLILKSKTSFMMTKITHKTLSNLDLYPIIQDITQRRLPTIKEIQVYKIQIFQNNNLKIGIIGFIKIIIFDFL